MPRLPVLALLLTIALAAASCGTSNESTSTSDTSTDSTSSTAEPTSTTSEPDATTSSAPATTTSAGDPTAEDATGDPRCDDPAVEPDIDGDGTPDRVAHVFFEGNAVLRLCASSVGYQELPGLGMAQQIAVSDIDGDGVDEVLYGATTAGSASYQLAVVDSGSLTAVTTGGGAPLVLREGFPDGFPPDGSRHAFGCNDEDGDGSPDLTNIVIARDGTELAIEGTAWRLDGSEVIEVAAVRARVPYTGDVEKAIDDIVADRAGSCG